MSKRVLGRGLGQLMTDSPVVERQEEISAPAAAPVSPGVGRLLHGKKEEDLPVAPDAELNSPAPANDTKAGSIRAIMILADFLLIAMACVLVLKTNAPFGALEAILCSLALALGAVLSCTAVAWRR